MQEPRDAGTRRRDFLNRLKDHCDMWVATSSAEGIAHLIPLSFVFCDSKIVLATQRTSVTVRNVAANRTLRLGLGDSRDVAMIDGTAVVVEQSVVEPNIVEAYIDHAGWDPRSNRENVFVLVTPTRIQAWREANEIDGREILGDRSWLVGDDQPRS